MCHARTRSWMSRTAVMLGMLASGSGGAARADEPLPPPETKTVWSANRAWCAVMDPRTDVTTVYRVEEGDRRTVSWAMIGWYRVAYLADDGVHLVIGHPGINLLPRDARETDVLLYFVHRGELTRAVPLRDVLPFSKLKPTVSHLLWGSYVGLDAEGRMVVKTVEEKVLRYDVATGAQTP